LTLERRCGWENIPPRLPTQTGLRRIASSIAPTSVPQTMDTVGGGSAAPSDPFTYSAAPRPVKNSRAKYRDEDIPTNIMADPRVARGSTYSLYRSKGGAPGGSATLPPPPTSGASVMSDPAAAKAAAKKRSWKEKSIYDYRPPSNTRDQVDLSAHLIERESVAVVTEVTTQTDTFEERPETPPYVPKKTGVDRSTQMTAEDQPFEFDREVTPLLEVLVHKTLEQSLLEVEQEEELEAIAGDLEKLQFEQEQEAARVRAIEAATVAEFRTKEERKAAERTRVAREESVRRKVASLRLMKQVWPEIAEETYGYFEGRGQWREPTAHAIFKDFLPWLYSEVDSSLTKKEQAHAVVDDLIHGAIAAQAAIAEQIAANEKAKAEAKAAEEAAKAKTGIIRVFLQAKSLGLEEDATVGPIEVGPEDTIADVEAKIKAFLEAEGIEVELPPEGLLHIALDGRELPPDSKILDEQVGEGAQLEVVLPSGETDET